ncbi:diguanylate cyclase [Caballeronia sordidicola]|uniref:Diguanylate cyclase n=1 Tax=Caballeronia sordidicola TaxID=196367 RepID=A0A158GQR0_CABSO|nr:GGDEF domain-containing protein [Caballeronia sordidicola]SAL34217.1 diguanylate cyclase [Caballeronia sordidicola]
MDNKLAPFSLPRWRFTTWLCHSGHDVPDDIRVALIGSLFGTLPIFAGGVLNTIAVSIAITLREPTPAFMAWVIMEVLLCGTRLILLVAAHRAARRGQPTYTDVYLLLGVLWGASVGYGAFISILSNDWIAATLSCLSAAAMVGGICFRNFGAPRLVAIMILLSLGPCCIAAAMSKELILTLTLIQIPFYLVAMSIAAFRLNGLLVSTMKAERENDYRARHDALTGLPNRAGLIHASQTRYKAVPGKRGKVAVLYIDLDGFKPVNDQYGHEAGDLLLVMIGGRLNALKGPDDMVFRIGGDEYVVTMSVPDRNDAAAFADRLINEMSAAFALTSNVSVNVGASIGVALVPDHGFDVLTALNAADKALNVAKAMGKARWSLAA